MKKWIFFDVMGVIFTVGDDTNDLLVPFVQKYNKSITTEKINDLYIKASLGVITSDEFWKKVGVCQSVAERKICKEYLDTCFTIDENFIKVAKQLEKNYNLAVLSNDVSEWSTYLRKKHGIDDIVKFSIISGDVKCRKPDIRIYQKAIDQANAEPGDCLFIDDRDKNLIPALTQGMKIIKFTRDNDKDVLNSVTKIASFLELEEIVQKIWY